MLLCQIAIVDIDGGGETADSDDFVHILGIVKFGDAFLLFQFLVPLGQILADFGYILVYLARYYGRF